MPANLLLLDEPTNHLDIPAREAIEAFVRETTATLLVVSHDRRLLETVCERLWVVDGGAAAGFDGGYRAWRAAVADGWTVAGAIESDARRLRTGGRPVAGKVVTGALGEPVRSTNGRTLRPVPAPAPAPVPAPAPAAATVGAVRGKKAIRGPKLSKDAYRRQRTALDAELTRLGLRKSHLELAMGDPGVAANFVELRRISSELADVSSALETAEQSWLELEERAP
jgi:energy-coupling factor transporter ATP-binding protein EcfA2